MLYRVTAQSFTTSHRIAKAVQAESPEAALRLVSNELADAGYYALDARPDQQSAIAAPAPLRDYAAFLLGVLEFRCTKAAAIARSPAPDCKELAAAIGSLMGIVDELIARNLLDPAEIRWCRQQAAPAVRATYCDADRRSAA